MKEDFLFWEVGLLRFTLEWEQIYNLCQIGVREFPDNINFYFNKTLAALRLEKLNEVEELIIIVAANFTANLDEDFAIAFSELAQEAFLPKLAIKILFPFAKDDNCINAREKYFHIFSFAYQNLDILALEKVIIESAVLVEVENQKKLLWINQNTIKIVPHNLLLDKEEGEQINHSHAFGIVTYKIIKILDPYEGLYWEINKLINENNAIGFNVKSLQVPTEDIESFNRLLVQTFGESGTIEENRVEGVYQDYKKRKVGFSSLVSMNSYNSIGTYYSLISDVNKGMIIFPINKFQNIKINFDNPVVLDFTSILLFFELQRKLNLEFPHKFIISKFLLQKIKLDIINIKLNPETKISVKINSKGVTPHLYPEGVKNNQLQFYEELLEWCLNHCISKSSRKKLKILGEVYASGENIHNETMQEMIDNLFLREEANTFLVSDDFSIYLSFFGKTALISTEYYLKSIFNKIFEESILQELLKMNYKGLNISYEVLKEEFDKFLLKEQNLYIQCLKNLITSNPNIVVEHIVEIYNLPLLIDQKRILAQQVWLNFLSEIKLSSQTIQALKNLLQIKFRFFPQLLGIVFQDLNMSNERLRYYR